MPAPRSGFIVLNSFLSPKLAAVLALLALLVTVASCGSDQDVVSFTPELSGDFVPKWQLGTPPAPGPLKPALPYLRKLESRLQNSWKGFLQDLSWRLAGNHVLNDDSLQAVLAIALRPDGSLEKVAVQKSSGHRDYDNTAIEIVWQAAPFPRPPAMWMSDDDRLHILWSFARDRRQAGAATAEVVRLELAIAEAVSRLVASGGGHGCLAAHCA